MKTAATSSLFRCSAGRRPRAGFLLFNALVLLSACTAPPATDSASAFPTLSEIAPAEPIAPPAVQVGERPPAVEVTLHRLTLPLGVSLEPAWAAVDEDVLPPLSRGVWRANGLRTGVLAADDLPGFLAGLPPAWEDRRFRIVRPDGPVIVRRSPPLVRPVVADLTVPPYAPRLESLLGHRAALLMEASPAGGGVDLRFTPLHQRPRPTVIPRTAAEKELDGRRFDELSLRLLVPSGAYAVVGLARDAGGLPTGPELAAEAAGASAPGAGAEPEGQDPQATLPPARFDPPPLPAGLGRALFTLPREPRGQPQVLLLVRG